MRNTPDVSWAVRMAVVSKGEQELDDAARKVQTIRRRSVAERKAKQETTAARGEAEMNAFEFMEKSDDAQNLSNLARRRWWRLLAVGILSRVPGLGRVGHSDEKKKEGGAANEDENPNASSSVIVILDEPRSPIPKSLERRLSLDRMLEMNSEANQGSAVVEVMPSLRKQTSLRKKDSEVKQTWWGALAKSLLRIPSRSFVNDDEDDEMMRTQAELRSARFIATSSGAATRARCPRTHLTAEQQP